MPTKVAVPVVGAGLGYQVHRGTGVASPLGRTGIGVNREFLHDGERHGREHGLPSPAIVGVGVVELVGGLPASIAVDDVERLVEEQIARGLRWPH